MRQERHNTAFADEIEAINSIYGPETIRLTSNEAASVAEVVLQLPNTPFSFNLAFETNYPDTQPTITGIHSVAEGAKGDGRIAESLLADTLRRVWTPGQVCLFDLIEAYEHAEENKEEDDDEDRSSRNSNRGSEEGVTAAGRGGNQPSTMYAALIRTHHITSRKKVATLKAAAKQIECAALLRSGGTPGVMYIESRKAENVQKWVDTVHGLRYKDYQLVSPTAVVADRAITTAEDGFEFDEVETVKEFGAKMQEKGILDWWRRAMGYVSE